jgi:hypothetical protein
MPRPELQNLRANIETEMAAQLTSALPQLEEQIRGIAQSVLQPTLAYAAQSGTYALLDAIVNIVVEIEGKGLDTTIRFWVQVQDASGKPHKVWHYLSGGTRDRIQKKTVSFPEREDVRTSPGDLQARPFLGYTGEWVTLLAGRRVSGIKARNWYSTAAPIIQKRFEALLPSGTKVVIRQIRERE